MISFFQPKRSRAKTGRVSMKDQREKVVVRVWRSTNTPILIFPDDKQPGGLVQMYEQVGQHGAGDPRGVVRATRPATAQEAEDAVKSYERHYNNCKLRVVKRVCL